MTPTLLILILISILILLFSGSDEIKIKHKLRSRRAGGSVALALLLAGCAPAPEARPAQAAAPDYPVTVRDDSGREIAFAAPQQRIACLSPAHTETLYALGGGERVVA